MSWENWIFDFVYECIYLHTHTLHGAVRAVRRKEARGQIDYIESVFNVEKEKKAPNFDWAGFFHFYQKRKLSTKISMNFYMLAQKKWREKNSKKNENVFATC